MVFPPITEDTMYTRDELNLVGTCIDLAIKAGGAGAAKTLLPLFEKTEQIAKDMDAVQRLAAQQIRVAE